MLRILFVTVALTSGGGAAWLAGAMGADATASGNVGVSLAPTQMEEVLVAATDIEQGGQLQLDDMRWQTWPRDTVQSAFVLRSGQPDALEELAGSVARSHLVAGMPLLAQSLAPAGSSLLSAVLLPGMRAVGIRISAEKTAGGFILPNDRVDVLLTVPCSPEDGCSTSMDVRTILKNVRVLAIDQAGGKDASETALIGKTATLELDPLQVETIVGAEASGTLSLVLRAAADHGEKLENLSQKRRTVLVRRAVDSEFVTLR